MQNYSNCSKFERVFIC